ncbi:MAG: CrcB family protein [Clostridia bacterium]|nr:CrcB family protein [Clostridia bacterium]
MRKYIFIGLGGFLGAVSRSAAKHLSLFDTNLRFPASTLIINLTGSFILAMFLTLILEKIFKLDEDLHLGISTGFLGAFTTFSTLCKEGFELINNGSPATAASYLLLSIVFGYLSVLLGVFWGKKIASIFNDRSNT